MNQEGHRATLVAAQLGNMNAVTFGAHSPRIIEQRAQELQEEFGLAGQLDAAGKIALAELARVAAVIEAIDHDLSVKGVSDRSGKERYLVARRERYSRRLIELSDRVLEAQARSREQEMLNSPDEIVGEQSDYIRAVQVIALGRHPHARVTDQLKALKLLTDLGREGTTSYFKAEPVEDPYASDPEIAAEVAELHKEIEWAKKRAHLGHLRRRVDSILLESL